MNYLPSKLLKLRKHYNYSQNFLAQTLGVDVMTYMGYENGREIINYNQAKKLAILYHITITEMLTNTDEVTLYNVSSANTDEINIEYFLPKKTFFQKLKTFFIRKMSIIIPVICAVIICAILLCVLPNHNNEEYTPLLTNSNRLSVNETSLIYIDEYGSVKGSGSNDNSQLSNLPSKNAVKVQEGSSFSIILLDDGSVIAQGLSSKYQDEISKWKDIVDIAAGDRHVVAIDSSGNVFGVGDNSYNQIDVDKWKNIRKIYAAPNGTIGIDSDGICYSTGEFLGTSILRNTKNIKDIDTSHQNIIILKEDGSVEYMAQSDKVAYIKSIGWKDVIDVACGNDFFAALKSDGTVVVAIENNKFEEIVSSWSNIIAIDAYDNYLIGYDGVNIYGAGKNDYHQFDDGGQDIQILPAVASAEIKIENSYIRVQFEPVNNCDFYQVTLHVGTGISKKVSASDVIEFDTTQLIENDIYKITIVSLGDDVNYEDSKPYEKTFTYIIPIAEETITTRNDLLGMKKEELESYLRSIGITSIEGYEDEGACMGDEEYVNDIIGIEPNRVYTKEELSNMNIKYKYCKLGNSDSSKGGNNE